MAAERAAKLFSHATDSRPHCPSPFPSAFPFREDVGHDLHHLAERAVGDGDPANP